MSLEEAINDGLQLRRADQIQAEGTRLLEKMLRGVSCRLCYAARDYTSNQSSQLKISFAIPLAMLQNLFSSH